MTQDNANRGDSARFEAQASAALEAASSYTRRVLTDPAVRQWLDTIEGTGGEEIELNLFSVKDCPLPNPDIYAKCTVDVKDDPKLFDRLSHLIDGAVFRITAGRDGQVVNTLWNWGCLMGGADAVRQSIREDYQLLMVCQTVGKPQRFDVLVVMTPRD
jgi:hypothetical protein